MKTYFMSKEPFDLSKFKPISNGDSYFLNKPKGGLWTSPTHDWLDWCNSEEPGWITNYFELDIDEQNLLQIFDEPSLRELELVQDLSTSYKNHMIDYESLVKQGYSGIWVKARQMRWCAKPNFYAWDCETILIFDSSIIQSTHPIQIPEEYIKVIECEVENQ